MRFTKGCAPLLRRHCITISRSDCLMLDHALPTSSSVTSSPAGLEMMKVAFSFKMRPPSLIGFVANMPHPFPGDGLSSKGASSGILRLRYARRVVRVSQSYVWHIWYLRCGSDMASRVFQSAWCACLVKKMGRRKEGKNQGLGCPLEEVFCLIWRVVGQHYKP